MAKRSAADVLKDIEKSDVDDVVDRVASMTPAERLAELQTAGFTEAELDAKADAWHERMQRTAVEAGKAKLEAEARAKSLRPAPRDRRLVLLIAAVAVTGIVLALLLVPRSAEREAPIAVPSVTAPPSATTGAPAPSQSAQPPDAAPPLEDKPRKN